MTATYELPSAAALTELASTVSKTFLGPVRITVSGMAVVTVGVVSSDVENSALSAAGPEQWLASLRMARATLGAQKAGRETTEVLLEELRADRC